MKCTEHVNVCRYAQCVYIDTGGGGIYIHLHVKMYLP